MAPLTLTLTHSQTKLSRRAYYQEEEEDKKNLNVHLYYTSNKENFIISGHKTAFSKKNYDAIKLYNPVPANTI